MIILKKQYLKILPVLLTLALFTVVNFKDVKYYYERILDSSGLRLQEFMEGVKKENKLARLSEEEYRRIIEAEEGIEEGKREESPDVDLRLNALSALLMDASNNRVLYEENGTKEMAMASTTKIMTCIIALENGNLSDVVSVSSYAASMPDVQLNIKKGEKYYLRDLLYSLMLESHNDVAVAIAEHLGGSVEGFATMMNDKVRALGCEHTNFVTPNGLDAEGHYTTARDLAVIASYAIKNDDFIKITNASTHQFKEITKGKTYTVSNKNRFLYMMDGAIGVKTGFTGKAGYCFVGALRQNEKTFISVVLGCGWPPSKNLKWSDTKKLMEYGLKNYKLRQIFEDVRLDPLFVDDGQKKYEPIELKGDIQLLLRDDEKVHIEYELPEYLKAPVKKDSIVGYAKYYIDDELYETLPIRAMEAIEKIDYKFCLKKIIELWSFQH